MQHGLIREFAKENFGPSYFVVPQGQNRTFQPLTLIVKEGSSFRATTRRVVMETLNKYIADDPALQSELAELKKQNLQKDSELRISSESETGNSVAVAVEVAENVAMSVKTDVQYGKLQLGYVQEEFYK